jgi:hypothetical protein
MIYQEWRFLNMTRIIIDLKQGKYGNKRIFPYIVQIGTGGTGGYVVQQVAQMLSIFNIPAKYVIADYDVIESKNLRNQLYIQKDVGKKKAEVLAQRYRAAYQIDIASYTHSYVEDVETLDSLFQTDYLGVYAPNVVYLKIIISCVDNNFSRKVFHQYFLQEEGNLLYLDVGNESVTLPEQRDKPKEQWTEEELQNFNNSGYTGQVVAGLKLNGKIITKPVAMVFPDILEDNDEIAPSQLSCTELLASEPQRLITNRYAAMAVCTYLNEIFSEGTLSNHITFFHAKRMYMRTEPIRAIEEE